MSFIPTLNTKGESTELSKDNPAGPSRNAIKDLGLDTSGNVLMLIDQIGLRRLVVAKNTWDQGDFPDKFASTALASDRKSVARGVSIQQFGGVQIRSGAGADWQLVRDRQGIPFAPTAMVFSGGHLWVGGKCFVACIDIESAKVIRFGYFDDSVREIRAGRDVVWILTKRGLYRIADSVPF